MEPLAFGVCSACGKVATAPMAKFPVSRPQLVKLGVYNVDYLPVCDGCVEEWAVTYVEKVARKDFEPERSNG